MMPTVQLATARALARHLAELARELRQRVRADLRYEPANGPLRRLRALFHQELGLDQREFADTYAQTMTYALLAAQWAGHGDLGRLAAVAPPFLAEFLASPALAVSEVGSALREANLQTVLQKLSSRHADDDPVLHFYELFLQEYDAHARKRHGVFATPRPVVAHIVRSVDESLRTDFGLEHGPGGYHDLGRDGGAPPRLARPRPGGPGKLPSYRSSTPPSARGRSLSP